ncbi:FAD-dependent oxidoreductase [Pedobacter sp. HMF7056]|uniref:FAD-dependent oxidoreductase n=2 Tax=Hufsiella ginkgonis TaxID=2695274 RepID=A0A7K1XSA9_9SPHI|nr:FAD-dependent oxidoreductase [Hufsiella ginkgonis]
MKKDYDTTRDILDVIIIGGSYAGLSAALALGRSRRKVLIIDSGEPCNRFAKYSHNFLTHDGNSPAAITLAARRQVMAYPTVRFLEGLAARAIGKDNHYLVETTAGAQFHTRKLLFATGIKDLMPDIPGFAECWGTSVVQCPYCHGYEFRDQPTGILMNGDMAADFAPLVRNLTGHLTILTNGPSMIDAARREKLEAMQIAVNEREVEAIRHENGYLTSAEFKDGASLPLTALYARPAFAQHCPIPMEMGCALTTLGHIEVNDFQQTTIPGVYAAGDNTHPMRSVAGAVAAGSKAGAMLNHELI